MKVLGLFSGGLDSRLAAAEMRGRGHDVRLLHLDTGFVGSDRRRTVEALAREGAIDRVDVRERYLEQVVRAPRHGYGSAMNPCLDCRIFMLREAARYADARGIDVLFTGEVVGQRAFDQSRRALARTESEAGVEGRLSRPLSAWTPTPDPSGGGASGPRFHGASRRAQLKRAAREGLCDPATPSGRCCRLADPAYARRLRDLLEHGGEAIAADFHELLALGRHFRLDWSSRLVVARNEGEVAALEPFRRGRTVLEPHEATGAVGLLDAGHSDAGLHRAASVVARYGSGRHAAGVRIEVTEGDARRRIEVAPADPARLESWRI